MPSSLAEQSKLMNSIAVLGTGSLNIDVIIIPNANGNPWLVPQSLVLDHIDEIDTQSRISIWNGQDVALYNLCGADTRTGKLIILESVADAYRLGIVYEGNLSKTKVKLNDVADVDFDDADGYVLQMVKVKGQTYQIPSLDRLSHELIDLDR